MTKLLVASGLADESKNNVEIIDLNNGPDSESVDGCFF